MVIGLFLFISLMVLIFVLLTSNIIVSAVPVSSINCQQDSDCILKDTPYCCGDKVEYYKGCYSINETPKEVNCSSNSPCPGLAKITSCECKNNKCIWGKNLPNYNDSTNQNKSFNLSNGRKAEIKIMPETASQKAIERLGELGFNIILKEVGNGNNTKAVYELIAKKEGKMLGLFKINGNIAIQVDAETGDIIKVKKPWWAFLASGI